ncbi:MAG: tetratricopeptide repeat protein [Myxococcales bacterium]|nr:tetratricopeptide repeat protein [Myxococcales bacterium]
MHLARPLVALALSTVLFGAACKEDKPADPGKDKKESKGEDKKADDKKADDKKADDKKADDKKADDKPEKKPDDKKATLAPPAKQAPKAADKSKVAAYWKAMTEGRKATVAKNYDDAAKAFDKALEAIPEDARAISERGYARVLAKDWKAAVADLDKAAARTKDKKLLGQIWFNYGLAAEGQGQKEKARAAFARSNELNPSKAAKAKLGAESVCVATTSSDAPSAATVHDSWKAAYEAMQKEEEALPAWTGEAELSAICQPGWKKDKACAATPVGFMIKNLFLLVPAKDGKIHRYALAMVGGRCGGEIESKIATDTTDLVHLHWRSRQGLPVFVTEKNGEMVPCGETDTECSTACGEENDDFGDLFVDKQTGVADAYVGRAGSDDGKDPVMVTLEAPVVKVKGKGCDKELVLAK